LTSYRPFKIEHVDQFNVIVSKNNANITVSPSKNTKIIAQAKRGEQLAILETKGDWYKVRYYNNRIRKAEVGWIHQSLVTSPKSDIIGETKTELSQPESPLEKPVQAPVPTSPLASAPSSVHAPVSQPPSDITVECWGADLSDSTIGGWKSIYPHCILDDGGGDNNAIYDGVTSLEGNKLCVEMKNLFTQAPPAHLLAIGFTINLKRGTFSDGSTKKTIEMDRFSGTPSRQDKQNCFNIDLQTTATKDESKEITQKQENAIVSGNYPSESFPSSPKSSSVQITAKRHINGEIFFQENFNKYKEGDPVPSWGKNLIIKEGNDGTKYLTSFVSGKYIAKQDVSFPENFQFEYRWSYYDDRESGQTAPYVRVPFELIDENGKIFLIECGNWGAKLPGQKIVDFYEGSINQFKLIKKGTTFAIYNNDNFLQSGTYEGYAHFISFRITIPVKTSGKGQYFSKFVGIALGE
jgi:hypothetical protein